MKITLTIDVPGVNPESIRATEILNAIEFAWDHRNTWANIGPYETMISQWWLSIDGGETRHMPEEEPHGSRDTFVPPPLPEDVDVLELKRLLREFWIAYPVIRHALLLYREASVSEAGVYWSNMVSRETKALHDMAAKVCDLPKD